MTGSERDLLRFVERHTADHDGVCPSYVEMAAGLGLKSKSSVFRLVQSLVDQGRLERRRGKYRSLAVVQAGSQITAASDQDLIAEVFRRFGADAGAACSRAQQGATISLARAA